MVLDIPKLKGKELKAYLEEKLDELADNLCQDPNEIQKFLERWNNGFHSYSMNNTLLIWIQRPESTLTAGYVAWKKRGRQVLKNSRGIRILAPMIKKIKEDNGDETLIIRGFRPVSVFDVSQTEGDELEEVGCPDLVSGDFDFETIVKASPVPVNIKDLGLSNGNTDGKTINITPKKNKAAMCQTLLHEIAHVMLFHCEESGTLFETEDKSIKEIEAETCNYICCEFLGIENNKSRLYIGNWGGNKEELQGRGKKILSVAESILAKIGDIDE